MNLRLSLTSLIALSMATAASQVWAVVHVSPQGTDTGDGRDPGTPVLTIGYAFTQANAGEEIRVASGTYQETLEIAGDAMLTGDWAADFSSRNDPRDPANTIITAGGTGRVILWQAANVGESFLIDGFSIRSGDAAMSAVLPGRGGGICATGGGQLTIQHCIVEDNTARSERESEDGPGFGLGGGIYAEQSAMITTSTIRNNVATSAVRQTFELPQDFRGEGGGIHFTFLPSSDFPASFVIEGTEVRGNEASDAFEDSGGGDNPALGGGIALTASDDLNLTSGTRKGSPALDPILYFSGTNLEIVGNTGKTGGFGIEANGGGIGVRVPDLSELSGLGGRQPNIICLSDSVLSGNNAFRGSGFTTIGAGAQGGGLYGDAGASIVKLVDCQILDNFAGRGFGPSFGTGGGAAIINSNHVDVIGCSIRGNTAASGATDGRGGGLDIIGGTANVSGCDISGNNALVPDSFAPNPAADGGGLFYRTFGENPDDRIVVENTCFIDNDTVREQGEDGTFRGAAFWFDNLTSPPAVNRVTNVTIVDTDQQNASTAGFLNMGEYQIHNNIALDISPVFSVNQPSGTIDNSLFRADFGQAILIGSGNIDRLNIGDNIISANPLFADEGNGDFRLSPNSPAIDAGNPSVAPATDFEGDPRDDGMPDLGYDEFIPADDIFDYGDVPLPYPVGNIDDGARHKAGADLEDVTPRFGDLVDYELDGLPSPNADNDDSSALDDEDGYFSSAGELPEEICLPDDVTSQTIVLLGGQMNTVLFRAIGPGKVNAFIDLNGDFDWFDDAADQIASDQDIPAPGGITDLTTFEFMAPDGLPNNRNNRTFGRFRISTAGGDRPFGAADDGEVEDYPVFLIPAIDLAITGTVSAPNAQPGTMFTHNVTVTNNSQQYTARDITVRTDATFRTRPGTGSVVDAISIGTTAVPAGTMFSNMLDDEDFEGTWTIAELAPMASLTLPVSYTIIASPTPGLFRVDADIRCAQLRDPAPTNNDTPSAGLVIFDKTPPSRNDVLGRILGGGSGNKGVDADPEEVNGDALVDVADLLRLQVAEID
ncbi:MAG: choice-of-anchor Q domain-containing protein [Sumerlaeia bacterium]